MDVGFSGETPLLRDNLAQVQGLGKPEYVAAIRQTVEIGQGHLFANWDKPGINDERKVKFCAQLAAIDRFYGELHHEPQGLTAYFQHTLAVINAPKAEPGRIEPVPPERMTAVEDWAEFDRLIAEGLEEFGLADVIVPAGGLGQRLGYKGIKLSLPVTLLLEDESSYLETYVRIVMAIQDIWNERHPGSARKIPIVIGTSLDNDALTRAFVEGRNGFRDLGVAEGQIRFACMHEVPAYSLVDGPEKSVRFALHGADQGASPDPYRLATMPYGHGDIHPTLREHGFHERWAAEPGQVVFIQDTNAQSLYEMLAQLGAMKHQPGRMGMGCIERDAKEKIGALGKKDGVVQNVEYNLLAAAKLDEPGRFNAGNANMLSVPKREYSRFLGELTSRSLPELANPKPGKLSRTETLMQDMALSIPAHAVRFHRDLRKLVFSTTKNSIADGRTAVSEKRDPETAATAEHNFYEFCLALTDRGAASAEFSKLEYEGIPVEERPLVAFSPDFILSADGMFKTVRRKIRALRWNNRSVLVLCGREIELDGVDIEDGTLVIRAVRGARVRVSGLKVRSDPGWRLAALTPAEMTDPSTPEILKMRGYRLERGAGAREYRISEPGDYIIGQDGDVKRVG